MTIREFETEFKRLYLPLGMYALRLVGDTDTDEADNYYHLFYCGYVPENYQSSCTLYTGTFNYEAEPILTSISDVRYTASVFYSII